MSGALQAGAFSMLARFNSLMLPHGGQWAELIDSNVPLHTVESLYPFELSNYTPFIVKTLRVPEKLYDIAYILGSWSLNHAFKTLPEEAYAEADRIVWFDRFFDGEGADALRPLAMENLDEGINGNAIFLMKQWGYLLLYLHECHRCPSLPMSGETERWYDDIRSVSSKLLDKIDPSQKSSATA